MERFSEKSAKKYNFFFRLSREFCTVAKGVLHLGLPLLRGGVFCDEKSSKIAQNFILCGELP